MSTILRHTVGNETTLVRISPTNPLLLEISKNDGADWISSGKPNKKVGEIKQIERWGKGHKWKTSWMVAINSSRKQFFSRDNGKHWCGSFMMLLKSFGILNTKLARRIFG